MKLEISISVDTDRPGEALALARMLESIGGGSATGQKPTNEKPPVEEKAADKTEEGEAAKTPRRRPSRKKAAPKAEEEKKEPETAPEKDTPEEEVAKMEVIAEEAANEDTPPDVTKEILQTLIREKSAKHREDLKKKLGELGAKNVSTLKEEHYAAFHEFMENLD